MNKEIDPGTLLRYIERIENLEQVAKNVAEDIKKVYNQAKIQGYDPKYIKQCVKYREALGL